MKITVALFTLSSLAAQAAPVCPPEGNTRLSGTFRFKEIRSQGLIRSEVVPASGESGQRRLEQMQQKGYSCSMMYSSPPIYSCSRHEAGALPTSLENEVRNVHGSEWFTFKATQGTPTSITDEHSYHYWLVPDAVATLQGTYPHYYYVDMKAEDRTYVRLGSQFWGADYEFHVVSCNELTLPYWHQDIVGPESVEYRADAVFLEDAP